MKIETTCPLGHKCETAKDDTLYRCSWYIQMAGKDPSTGNDINNWGCAMGWLPILLVENAKRQIGTTAALESFRNEVVKENAITKILTTTNTNSN